MGMGLEGQDRKREGNRDGEVIPSYLNTGRLPLEGDWASSIVRFEEANKRFVFQMVLGLE